MKRCGMRQLVLLILCLPVFLGAQEKRQLSIGECLAIGMQYNKSLVISRSKAFAAREKSGETNAAGLPSLKFSGSYSRLSPVDPFAINMGATQIMISPSILNNYQARLTLSQPLFTGFRVSGSSEMMEFIAAASEEDLHSDQSQLMLDITNRYWSYYKAMEFRRSVGENLSQMAAHLADIQNMLQQGLATNNDVLKVKVQLNNVELMYMDAENAVQLALLGLNSTLGLPLNTDIDITSKPEFKTIDVVAPQTLIEQALVSRPEVKGMELRVKASQASVTVVQSAWYPQIAASANYLYASPNSRIFPSVDRFNGTWDVGVSLGFDIWNWQTASHQSAQAKASLEQSQAGLTQLKDAITLDVTASYLSAMKAKHKVGKAEEGSAQAQENYRITNSRFKSGLVINSELLDAETALLQANINYTSAVVDFLLASAALQRAVGK